MRKAETADLPENWTMQLPTFCEVVPLYIEDPEARKRYGFSVRACVCVCVRVCVVGVSGCRGVGMSGCRGVGKSGCRAGRGVGASGCTEGQSREA